VNRSFGQVPKAEGALGLEGVMQKLNVQKIGRVAVVRCEGRIVRSAAAFRLRDAVTQQKDARVVLLDLSDVKALEGGGLGMLLFLHIWARYHGIQLKVFDPSAGVRQSLERACSAARVEIAGMGEVLSLLG
jgi:anti-anti-sigma regulatory factor